MSSRPFIFTALLLSSAAAAAATPALAQDMTIQVQKADRKLLTVGDAAPKLDLGKWVKGDSLTSFAKGRVYVMEFGATWCGPCRQSIPHLSELQNKFKDKLTIASIHVWENMSGGETQDSILTKVKAQYDAIQPPIAHRVAIDSPTQSMASNWLGAAGLNSIPQAFIVVVEDAGPKIAWIGHPMSPQFEATIQSAIDGKIDMKAEAKKAADENARKARYEQTLSKAQQAANSNDTKTAIAALDAALAEETDAQYRGSYLRMKFSLLMKQDPAAASSLGNSLLQGEFKDSESELMMLCDLLTNADSATHPDSKLAVALAERASTIAKGENPRILHSLAGAYYLDKQIDKAIATQELSIAAYKKTLGEAKSAVLVSMAQARIDEWKKSKN